MNFIIHNEMSEIAFSNEFSCHKLRCWISEFHAVAGDLSQVCYD
jgi:hypothetical protein